MATPAGIHPSSRSRNRRGHGGAKSVGTLLLMVCLWGTSSESPGGFLRLEGGPNRCVGRVEVLHNGTWGTVCDDGWGFHEGQVVCRELGCGPVLAVALGSRYGEGKGQIWLDEVNCTGEEKALRECRARPWGEHNCNHVEDASVECSGTHPAARIRIPASVQRDAHPFSNLLPSDSIGATPGTLQLVNGLDRCSGRVEVLHEHRWGTVCDDGWDLADAAVVCRQLGCGTALAATHGAHFGRGHDPIWLDEVNCTGTEDALVDCQAREWGNNNCFHGEDAGVVCSGSAMAATTELRLANGSTRCDGRVEVPHQGSWASLCDEDWGAAEARVLCRQLGCGTALVAPARSRSAQGGGQRWPNRVSCAGTESALSMCKVQPRGNGSCLHGREAVVVCSGNSEGDQVRLVNYGNRCAGRVEIFHNHQWGTVCDDNWDLVDAEVVCRQLDCGRALSAPGRAQFGRGDGIIWMDETNCTGTESALSSCPARPWGTGNCYHGEDAGVVCSGEDITMGTVEGWSGRRSREQHSNGIHPPEAFPWVSADSLIPEPASIRLANTSHRCAGSGIANSPRLRLVGGLNECSGRVEVFYANKWGTICDDNWDLQDAAVVCRVLGCGAAALAPGSARFGWGSGPIWLDNVGCSGQETDFFQCPAKMWGIHNCHHGEDAGVVCGGERWDGGKGASLCGTQ
ncbi:deleted in malignant brain tumors 1 protein-like protein [Amazona aestiva]|uniref:Soluble scavenger receptor cysteine-rich domain-containing protein SSC5D n=1 Tax=Amazona aestiva TaxID=12930 RepID=A0A0Q3PV25_AMAAE|nr:deleted in malignant brain tumors 1 protein-like protein [Amazona aestiva]